MRSPVGLKRCKTSSFYSVLHMIKLELRKDWYFLFWKMMTSHENQDNILESVVLLRQRDLSCLVVFLRLPCYWQGFFFHNTKKAVYPQLLHNVMMKFIVNNPKENNFFSITKWQRTQFFRSLRQQWKNSCVCPPIDIIHWARTIFVLIGRFHTRGG